MALPHAFYNSPPAYMGFVGFVKLKARAIVQDVTPGSTYQHGDILVRATSADLNLTQEVTKPDVIDSRYDRTVYQLGPKLIDGSIAFPAVYDMGASEGTANETNIVEATFRHAVTRNIQGLLTDFDLDVKYATTANLNLADFTYYGCIANTWQFAVAAEDVINISMDVIGLTREIATTTTLSAEYMKNTRICTWNDSRVEIRNSASPGAHKLSENIGGEYVRSFEANINNNADRFYTLNTYLYPQAIAPTKRDVTGNVVLLGRHTDLAELAYSNQNFCSETVQIAFGFETKLTLAECQSSFGTVLPNCVFQIEEMTLSNEIFETTVNWHSLPAAGTGVNDPLLQNMNPTFEYPKD